jgi:hypothetical protein
MFLEIEVHLRVSGGDVEPGDITVAIENNVVEAACQRPLALAFDALIPASMILHRVR